MPLSYKRMNTAPPGSQRRSKDARPTDTRARLLAATAQVVAEGGVAGATSRDIAAAAGTNLASITYHFGSKDALVAAALVAEVERLVEPALAALEGDGEPSTRMLDAVGALLEAFDASRHQAPAYLEALVASTRSGEAGDEAHALIGRLRERLRAVIVDLQESEVIPPWIAPEAMAALVVAVANGIVLQGALDPTGPAPEAQALQFAGLLVAAQG